MKQIDSETCIDTLILADELSASDLKSAAKIYILKNKVDMSKLEEKSGLLMELLKESMAIVK